MLLCKSVFFLSALHAHDEARNLEPDVKAHVQTSEKSYQCTVLPAVPTIWKRVIQK